MEYGRGILMVAAASIAFWKAWKIHSGPEFWLALGLGILALALAVWHFLRHPRTQQPRR